MAAAADYRLVPYGTARVVKIKGTSSYGTGGYDLSASPFTKVSNAPAAPVAINDGSAVIGLVAAGKVKFITAATGAEVAAASDQSGNAVLVLVP